MKQQAERGGRETVKGTVSQSTHGSVIELRSDHLLTISAAKKNVHQSWTLACGHLGYKCSPLPLWRLGQIIRCT